MDLERFDLILRIRVWASAVFYAIFVGVGLHGVLNGWHYDNPTPAVVLLLIAFFSWPRKARPKGWDPDLDCRRDRQQEKARGILQRRFNKVRLYYFFGAFFLLALLPHFLGEPVFQVLG